METKPGAGPNRKSTVTGLACRGCGARYGAEYHVRCPACGGVLVVQYDLGPLGRAGRKALEGSGLWRWRDFLPIRDTACEVTLGEGATPLLRCERLGREIGLPNLYIKWEGANPTGTFKDRTSATAISAALEFGFGAVGVVSTGNAGSSIGAYAARAGLKSVVFCYGGAAMPKVHHMSAVSSRLIFYEGFYDDFIEIFDRLCAEGVFYDAGATGNPYKHEGKKTIALEIAEQLDWRAPDYVAYPVAMGEGILSGWRGFQQLQELGWIDRLPRMTAIQPAAVNPIVLAFRSGGGLVPQKTRYSLAEGAVLGNPGAKGEWVLEVLRQSGGLAEDITEEEIVAAHRLLAHTEGIYAGPTGVVPLAGLRKLAFLRKIEREATVVCVITETGLKGDYPPMRIETVKPDYDTIKEMIAETLES